MKDNEIDRYVEAVVRNIQTAPQERDRIAADLRLHLQEAVEAGEPVQEALARMGSPEELATAYMSPEAFHFASFGRRLGAWFLDMLIVILVAGLAAMLAAALGNLVPRNSTGWVSIITGAVFISFAFGFGLLAVGMMALYFPILEGRFGQTLGKRFLGLRVLKENGLPIGYKEAFIRRLSYYFEFLPVDGLFILFSERRQRALDIVARTIVVEEGA